MSGANGNGAVKVAFDTAALKPRYRNHGVQVYARNLLQAMRPLASSYGLEIQPFVSPAAETDDESLPEGPGFQPRKSSLLKFDRLWRYGGASATAYFGGADIVFNPNGATLPLSRLIPAVTTIHDLTPMVMPCFSRRTTLLLKFLVGRAAAASAAIITVSENSRRDLMRICGIPAEKVHVIHEGYDRKLFNDAEADSAALGALLNRVEIYRPYILHHGAIQPRKNLVRLIAAYRRVLTRNPNFSLNLILAGPQAWQCEDTVSAAQNCSCERGRVVLTGALNDADLSLLLKGAALVVIPSLYEGFCLPMVEAMACGVPTIAANNSCLPEISGGVLRYFDPYSAEEMAMRIEEVLQHKELRTELSQRGKAYVQKYNWQLCAEETLAVLSQVAGQSRGNDKSAGVAV